MEFARALGTLHGEIKQGGTFDEARVLMADDEETGRRVLVDCNFRNQLVRVLGILEVSGIDENAEIGDR